MFEIECSIRTAFAICAGVFAFLLVSVCLFGGCNGNASPVLGGTYVNQAKSEFSMASDTLIVSQEQENNYVIHRKTGIRLLDENGKAGKLIHETEDWKAVYDPEKAVMTESRKGRLIRFEDQGLRLENSAYRRIE